MMIIKLSLLTKATRLRCKRLSLSKLSFLLPGQTRASFRLPSSSLGMEEAEAFCSEVVNVLRFLLRHRTAAFFTAAVEAMQGAKESSHVFHAVFRRVASNS